ncbi:MAG: twin-arginine translocase TatA/TatE family subunit [Acidimicrobiales bacterium]|jgi:sec-independent protein translocase protein TatA
MIANMFGSDGLIVLVVAVVVLFGGSQLPKLAKNVGSAGREFRRAQAEAELDHAWSETAAPPAAVPAPAVLPVAVAVDDRMVVSRSELRQHVASLLEERDRPSAS